MSDTDPVVAIYSLLDSKWDASETVLSDDPTIHTGRYGKETTHPSVTIHGLDDGVLNGGETGFTYNHGPTGKSGQLRQGTVTIDIVAGTRGDVDSNPKKVRHSLTAHVQQILLDFRAEGLHSLSPGSRTDIEESSDEEDTDVLYRSQLRASYIQRRDPSG